MKLTSIMRWNSAASERPDGADSAAPALATRTSIGCRTAASAMADLTKAWSATSAAAEKCAAPDATAASSVARLRPSTVTVAPAFDSAAATASPMPRPPPVTSAWEERDNGDIGLASRGWSSIYFKLQAFAIRDGGHTMTCRPPRRRGTRYAAVVRFYHRCLWILDPRLRGDDD